MQLLDKGVDIYTIAVLPGHRQVSSTQNYAKMSSKKMIEAIGGKKVIIRLKVQRYKCKYCDFDQQERIPFATGSRSYTHRSPRMWWTCSVE